MIPRTFMLAALCALCVMQVALADTRVSVSGGMAYPFTFGYYGAAYGITPLLSLAVDAPKIIRQRMPLEAVIDATWIADQYEFYEDYGPWYWYKRDGWLVTSEAVRFYAVGNHTLGHPQSSSLELGLGVGLHQFWPYMTYMGDTHGKLRRPHTQWRGHAFLRYNFHSTRAAGLYYEVEVQHVFDDLHQNGFPRGAVLMKLGWHFRV